MRNQTRIVSIALGLSLIFSSVAAAGMIIPPVPIEEPAGPFMPPRNDRNPGGGPGYSANTESPLNAVNPINAAEATNTAGPEEPVIGSEGAVLMDAATGKLLYGKNQDKQFYPASITKVMTALLVLEHCSLNEVVTFSAAATTNLESGSVTLNLVAGDTLTVEQSLHGLLLKSANEIANGLAEHVSGSVSAFADKMNARAVQLGCRNTHFVNPNGLNNSAHKTTPYDMALILRAALQNEIFRKIDTTLAYQFPATRQAAARTITMGHKMMYPSDSRYYEGIIGGKTGYTSLAGNTLVTGAERNGVRLIAVVMKSGGTQYTDTIALLDYGFANYSALAGNAGQSHQAESDNEPAGPVVSVTGWISDATGWKYIKPDGRAAAGEWQIIDDLTYWFDTNSCMATGWRQFSDGAWYYFKPAGYMARSCWILDQGDWFCLGADGKLLQNTTTPDGYQVDENGVWKQ